MFTKFHANWHGFFKIVVFKQAGPVNFRGHPIHVHRLVYRSYSLFTQRYVLFINITVQY
jgi:hypothetical protein